MNWKGLLAKVTGAFSPSPVTAVASAVGAVAGAVSAGEQLANNKQVLAAGAAEGQVADVAKTEERVADAAAARDDKQLRVSVAETRFRD